MVRFSDPEFFDLEPIGAELFAKGDRNI